MKPASLTRQWQRELADKFLLPFGRALGGASPRHEYLLPVAEERASSSLYAPDLVIVSTGLVARKERRQEIDTARPFDITLVDEAHYARRKIRPRGAEPRRNMAISTRRSPRVCAARAAACYSPLPRPCNSTRWKWRTCSS